MGSFDWDLDTGLLHMDGPPSRCSTCGPTSTTAGPATPRPCGSRRSRPHPAGRAWSSQALKDGSRTTAPTSACDCATAPCAGPTPRASSGATSTGRPRRIIGIVRDATQELADSAARRELPTRTRRRAQTNLVQITTAALAHARTVQDVIDVLKNTHGLAHLGATSLVMGLVEAGRIHLVADGPEGAFVPGTLVTRTDEPYPMSEVIRTLTPRFIESPEDFAGVYPVLWPHITDLEITSAAYLPLIAQARPIGAIGLLYSDKPRLHRGRAQPPGRARQQHRPEPAAGHVLRAGERPRRGPPAGHAAAPHPRRAGRAVAVRYRSARHRGRDIGGDWYDVIPLPGGRVGAVIGDVQGHDTHAAAVMGQLRIVLRAYAAEGHSPATVMARASVFLHELDTDRFATCTVRRGRPVHRGRPAGPRRAHRPAAARTRRELPQAARATGGLPLGLSAEFGSLDYPVSTVELDPGQTLLLYTDGLVEQPGADLDDGMQAAGRHDPRRARRTSQQLADRLCEVADGARRRRRRGAAAAAPHAARRPAAGRPAPAACGARTTRRP